MLVILRAMNSGFKDFSAGDASSAFCCALGAFAALCAGTAQAYIDPGSGYLLFQAIAALVAAVVGTIGLYWRKFKGIMRSAMRRLTGRGADEPGEMENAGSASLETAVGNESGKGPKTD